jgi:hypothetical protein
MKSKKFQKKKPKLAKKAKIGQKSQNWPKRPKISKKPKSQICQQKPKLAKIRLFWKI